MKTVIDVLRVALIVFAISDALYLLYSATQMLEDIRNLIAYMIEKTVGLPEGIVRVKEGEKSTRERSGCGYECRFQCVLLERQKIGDKRRGSS